MPSPWLKASGEGIYASPITESEEVITQERDESILLLLSHFSRVRLCATPSLGFSRQEHWSGLPFPSPMHKSGKWKRSRSVMSDSLWPHGLQPTRLPHSWDFPGKSPESIGLLNSGFDLFLNLWQVGELWICGTNLKLLSSS